MQLGAMECRGGLTMEGGRMMTMPESMNVPFGVVDKGDSNNGSDRNGDGVG